MSVTTWIRFEARKPAQFPIWFYNENARHHGVRFAAVESDIVPDATVWLPVLGLPDPPPSKASRIDAGNTAA